jgi:hypothetical protein
MSKPHRINKAFILLIILAFTLGFFTPVLADYIGPNRSVTTYEVEAVDYGVWAKAADGSCNPTHNPPACIVCEWEGSPGRPCDDAEYSYKTANIAQQQQAYDIYRQGEYISVPIQNNNPFAGSSVGSGGFSTTVPVNSLTNTSGSLISLLPSWFLPLVIGVTVLAGIVILDSIIDPRGHATNPSPTCRDSYAECFNQNQRLDFTSVIRPTGNNLDTI